MESGRMNSITVDPIAVFIFAFVALAPSLSQSSEAVFCVMTERPHDGDTLSFVNITGYSLVGMPKEHLKLRVLYVDSPEISQPHGKESRDAVYKRCKGYLWIKPKDIDNFGRLLGSVDASGDLARWMIKHGHAHPFMVPANKKKKLHKLARKAIKARRGLWSSDVVVLPSDYRSDKKAKGKPRAEYLEVYA